MKIAVFGGSFNPIHNGHIELADKFSEHLQCDKLLIVPTKTPPHKSADEYVSDEHRMNMCRIAAQKIRNAEVSDIEISKNRVSYTYKTLKELKKQYKDAELYLICGSDMFMTLQEWKRTVDILKSATICSAPRAGQRMEIMRMQRNYLESIGGNVILLPLEIKPYSSSEIRNRISKNESVEAMLLPEISKYIASNALYKN